MVTKGRSTLVAVFQPEIHAKTIQAEFLFHKTSSSNHFELQKGESLGELVRTLQEEAGEWVASSKCGFIQWATVEYDSPSQHVITAARSNNFKICSRPHSPLKKFSVLYIDTLNLDILYNDHNICLDLESPPTIDQVLEYVNVNSLPLKQETIVFILTPADRYLCSSTWMKKDIDILQLLHKDELEKMPSNSLHLVITDKAPPGCYSVIIRMTEQIYSLDVQEEMTICECRYQLECRGGPPADVDKSTWLFGGIMLEMGHTVQHYGITHNNTIDVIIRTKRKIQQMEMKDPIVIENESHIDTTELVYKDKSFKRITKKYDHSSKLDKSTQKKMQRSNTILRGKVNQEFIEVNALDVDERYNTTLMINLLPKEAENLEKRPSSVIKVPERNHSKGVCVLL